MKYFYKLILIIIPVLLVALFLEIVAFYFLKNNISIPMLNTLQPYNEATSKYKRLDKEILREKPIYSTSQKLKRSDLNYNKAYPSNIYEGRFLYKRNVRERSQLLSKDNIIYDVNYTIDSFSRRQHHLKANISKHLIVIGGSYVFGEGVEDSETLPAKLSKYSENHQVYNFGVQGGAITQLLYNLKSYQRFSEGVKERGGALVYIMHDFHFDRIFNTSRYRRKALNYKKRHGRENTSATLTAKFNPEAGFLEYLAESQKHFGTENAYLVLAPGFEHKKVEVFHSYFKNNENIKLIDLSTIDMKSITNKLAFFPGDNHPTKYYHDTLAQILLRELQLHN